MVCKWEFWKVYIQVLRSIHGVWVPHQNNLKGTLGKLVRKNGWSVSRKNILWVGKEQSLHILGYYHRFSECQQDSSAYEANSNTLHPLLPMNRLIAQWEEGAYFWSTCWFSTLQKHSPYRVEHLQILISVVILVHFLLNKFPEISPSTRQRAWQERVWCHWRQNRKRNQDEGGECWVPCSEGSSGKAVLKGWSHNEVVMPKPALWCSKWCLTWYAFSLYM